MESRNLTNEKVLECGGIVQLVLTFDDTRENVTVFDQHIKIKSSAICPINGDQDRFVFPTSPSPSPSPSTEPSPSPSLGGNQSTECCSMIEKIKENIWLKVAVGGFLLDIVFATVIVIVIQTKKSKNV